MAKFYFLWGRLNLITTYLQYIFDMRSGQRFCDIRFYQWRSGFKFYKYLSEDFKIALKSVKTRHRHLIDYIWILISSAQAIWFLFKDFIKVLPSHKIKGKNHPGLTFFYHLLAALYLVTGWLQTKRGPKTGYHGGKLGQKYISKSGFLFQIVG